MSQSTPVTPYGGVLINLLAASTEVNDLVAYANSLPGLQLSARALCDLELLATGAFSPLDRFMSKVDYQRVLDDMRLADDYVFPIPITLPTEQNPHIREGREIALCNLKNEPLAIMTIEEVYDWDMAELAVKVFGSQDSRHPLVEEMNRWGKINISGSLRVLRLPRYYDFLDLRLTPADTRARLESFGRVNVVAFQTRNPLHRAHEEMTKWAMEEKDAVLLLHPAVGLTQPGDVDHYSRVRSYKILTERYYDPQRVLLGLVPLAMRMAGPREALWHAVIRRNYGANFLIVGRDHASPGLDSTGRPFYAPYAAQELVQQFGEELGVGVVPFQEMVYLPTEQRYQERSKVPPGMPMFSLSGTDLRQGLQKNDETPPEWLARPEIIDILSDSYPPRHRQGVCVWLTGLSCAGKSTIAEILTSILLAQGRRVTLLDGDVVRTYLSKGLGFTREDRDINIRRIGFVASEIVRHGGVAVCAAISPYRAARQEVRNMMADRQFVEVFVDAPLEVCEQRDTKGMYEKARRGEIKDFTGIDDPYESPEHAELRLDSFGETAENNANRILDYLLNQGFTRPTL